MLYKNDRNGQLHDYVQQHIQISLIVKAATYCKMTATSLQMFS